MSYSTTNTATIRQPSSILNTLFFGTEYFTKVYKLASYLGDGQVALDEAEILYQLVLRKNRKYISREFLSAYLCMDTQKVAKAISGLKKSGMVVSHKKGYIIVPTISHDREWTNDETFDFYNVLHSLDYESAMEKIWELMSLIHTFQHWLGTGIPDCSKRHFIVCLCMGKPFDCSAPKAKQVCEKMLNFDLLECGQRFSKDNYEEQIKDYEEWKTDKKRRLAVYQKAKMLLIRPDWWGKKKPHYIPQEAYDVVDLAKKELPQGKHETLRDALNKWNTFCYEYIVHHPTTDDYDFNPCSPFYGLTLEERLEMLPESIGEDSEVYQRGYLTQEQWVGVFNAEGTEFLKHELSAERVALYTDVRKWERERRQKKR